MLEFPEILFCRPNGSINYTVWDVVRLFVSLKTDRVGHTYRHRWSNGHYWIHKFTPGVYLGNVSLQHRCRYHDMILNFLKFLQAECRLHWYRYVGYWKD